MMNMAPLEIGLLAFPGITQLDMTAPFECFARLPNAKVHILWKTLTPVTSDVGFRILPTTRFEDCPQLDVICVPGGPGQIALMDDETVIDFVRRQGTGAKYVTSVCTGALVLGAAGLLEGYRAATHWTSRDNLPLFGAIPDESRVCIDRNRITGGGITAGLDFGLIMAEILADKETAAGIELVLEYTPAPPHGSGSPKTAAPAVLQRVSTWYAPILKRRKEASVRAAERRRGDAGVAA